jgi:lysozyme
VSSRLGVKPMIYTTQPFWSSYMSDSTWYAENGYKVLWIARWGTTSPSIPASSWDGHSWTFWQYSDCGSVPGISSRCVDVDRFRGSDLSVATW